MIRLSIAIVFLMFFAMAVMFLIAERTGLISVDTQQLAAQGIRLPGQNPGNGALPASDDSDGDNRLPDEPGVVSAGPARLDRPLLASDSVEQARQRLIAARKQQQETRNHSLKLEQQAQNARAEAERARREARAMAARIQEAEAGISTAEARIALIGQLQKQQAENLGGQQGPIVRLNAALLHMARRPTYYALLQPGRLDEMVHLRSTMDTVMPQVEKRTSALRAQLQRSRELRQREIRAREQLADARKNLQDQRKKLAELEARRRVEARQYVDKAKFEQERALGLGERVNDLGELLETVEANAALRGKLEELDGPVLRPQDPENTSGSGHAEATAPKKSSARPAYRLPVVGRVVIGLGERSKSGVHSRGLTLRTQPAAQVVAPAKGRVAYAGAYRGYGQIVILDHDQGWTTLITHMEKVTVSVGDIVDQGAAIGQTPGKGDPLVTIELRRRGRPVDMLPLLE